jgi:predicted AAA+ superfamily ATPase
MDNVWSLKKREEELTAELTVMNRRLWEMVGSISVLYPENKEISDPIFYIGEIDYKFNTLWLAASKAMRNAENIGSKEELDQIPDNIYKDYLASRDEITAPIDNLVNYMKLEIEREPPWWMFWK